CFVHHSDLPSFPTRRSSDLSEAEHPSPVSAATTAALLAAVVADAMPEGPLPKTRCGRSTRTYRHAVEQRLRRSRPGRVVVLCERSEEHTSELQSRVDLVCRL